MYLIIKFRILFSRNWTIYLWERFKKKSSWSSVRNNWNSSRSFNSGVNHTDLDL